MPVQNGWDGFFGACYFKDVLGFELISLLRLSDILGWWLRLTRTLAPAASLVWKMFCVLNWFLFCVFWLVRLSGVIKNHKDIGNSSTVGCKVELISLLWLFDIWCWVMETHKHIGIVWKMFFWVIWLSDIWGIGDGDSQGHWHQQHRWLQGRLITPRSLRPGNSSVKQCHCYCI